jgi:hypothetical protein
MFDQKMLGRTYEGGRMHSKRASGDIGGLAGAVFLPLMWSGTQVTQDLTFLSPQVLHGHWHLLQ